jgi:hypothetical protein
MTTEARDRAGLDRAGLTTIADAYVKAMVAHDSKKAPLAANAVIVENLKKIQPTEGLWAKASAEPTTFKIYIPDTVAQTVGYMCVMQADDKPIQLGLRLKLDNGKIAEAEQIVVYSLGGGAMGAAGMKNLEKPRAAFSQPVNESYRDSRGNLIRIAGSYYDALELNNGRLCPFADDCVRHENGMQTCRNVVPGDWAANTFGVFGAMTAAAQLDSHVMSYITRLDNRRIFAADEEFGLAVGFSHFRHAMEKKEFKVFGVPGVETWPMNYDPFDLPAMHIYKVWGGQLHEIDALGFMAPYMADSHFK